MSGPTARVLELLSLLQTHRMWSGPELAERLEVSERTLRRDIDRLRSLGYPVDAVPGFGGGYRLTAGTHLPPLVLDDDEAVAIAVGLRTAADAAVAGIEETSLRALAKLEQLLPDHLRRRVGSVHANVSVLRWHDDRTEIRSDVLALLAQGCRDHEEVGFDYRRRDGEESRRRVQPHHLVSVDRRWYLVGWDVRRADWRTFRVDRLDTPVLAGGRFAPRQLPVDDVGEFVRRAIRRQALPHSATVVVRADAAEIARAAIRLDAEVVRSDRGRTRLRLRSDSIEWLTSMIVILMISFDDLDVDAPPPVRELLDRLAERWSQR